jgi:hypothetical protein
MPSYLTKPDEPIHFGKPWRSESEPGLFLTSCELVVSINDASEETTHIGYRLIAAKHATCSDCIKREGRDILESVQYHRSYILL